MKAKASINECVQEIAEWLERLHRPAAKLLQAGLSSAEIARVQATLPFKLTAELRALYRASNGVQLKPRTTLNELQVIPGYYLLSLSDAAREYRQQQGAPQWRKGWFPIFANGAGDYYLVPCAPASRGVIGFLRGEPEQPIEYASVTAMFQTFAQCFAQGAFYVKRRDFTIDDDKHRQIAIKLNPRVRLWREEEEEAAEAARNAEEQRLRMATARLIQKKKPLEALPLFEQLVEIPEQESSTYVNALYTMICAIEQGAVKPARIRRMLTTCLAQKSLHGDAFLNAAFCWIALGKKDECIANLQKAKSKRVDLRPHLGEKLFAPLATDKRFLALKKSAERR